jgi:uncharacterized integral membrane protein
MNVSRALAAIALLVVVIALIAFSAYNTGQPVDIKLFWFRAYYGVPLIVALFAAFAIGVGLTLLYSLYYFVDLGLTVRRLKKRTRNLEAELVAIRSLPIEEALGDVKTREEEEEGKEVAS